MHIWGSTSSIRGLFRLPDTPLSRGSSLGTLCVKVQVCLCVGSNTLTRTPSPTAVLTTNLGPYAVPPLRMRVQSLESRVDI